MVPAELIPLGVLALDLQAPAEWSAYLADRVVQIVLDDLGRASIPAPTPGVSSPNAAMLRRGVVR
jgi:hypothetical protein